jgi:chromosome segregation ATPase
MTDPTYDPRIPIAELERLYTNLDRQQEAHGRILERIQSRLTDLERGPKQAAADAQYYRTGCDGSLQRLSERIGALESKLTLVAKQIENLAERVSQSEDEEPTGYEGYSDDALLAAFVDQCEGAEVDEDLIREAVKRRDAR